MTDIVSTVTGMPGAFISCIQWFEYYQSARSFENEHREIWLHFDILEARLARWGQCIGILGPDFTLGNTQIERRLELHLESIKYKLEKAQQKMTKSSPIQFVRKKEDPTSDIVRQWTAKYAGTYFQVKTKIQWAIHDKKVLEDVVCKTREHMNDMMHVFPAAEMKSLLATQRKLQENDVQSLGLSQLQRLKHLAKDDDVTLAETVEYAIRSRNPPSHDFAGTYNINGANDAFNFRLGDEIGRGIIGYGHNYSGNFTISGSGSSSFGNMYH